MLIDWHEAQRIIEQADAAQKASRIRRRQIRAGLVELAGREQLLGVDFQAAAAGHTPPPSRAFSPFVLADRLDTLFSIPKVRQAVERELGRVERSKLLAYVGEVADELELWRPGPNDLPLQWDVEAAQKLRQCSDPEQHVIGIHWHANPEGGEDEGAAMVKVQRRRCWLRICPKCSQDHAARLRARYEGRIQKVLASRVAGCSLKHLTLTLPRSLDSRGDLSKLHRCTKKLVKHFWGAHGQGAFATAELGPLGGNVHAHIIVYGRYVRQDEISRYWKKLTENAMVVWIKQITPSRAVREGLKYITKLGERDESGKFTIQPSDLAELHMALKGRRRVWSWGCFYGLADEDADKAPDEVATDEPGSALCKCGEPMLFLTVPEARALLHLKGATNCWPNRGRGRNYGAGIGAGAGPPV